MLETLPFTRGHPITIKPKIFRDERGSFSESYHRDKYKEIGIDNLVQSNLSVSKKDVIRGLHYQHPKPQGKLVSCVSGSILDVAVDIRVGSITFGEYWTSILDSTNFNQFWIPPGFAHGFKVLSNEAVVSYLTTEIYIPENDCSILWNDPTIRIQWNITNPILSDKDRLAPKLSDSNLPRI